MGKKDDLIAVYKDKMKSMKVSLDEDLLMTVVNGLGPSIYLADASKVSCSDKQELDRVKKNFLVKKLGMSDEGKMDAAIKAVCEQFGSSDRNKYRAVFYYLLCQNLGKRP